LSRPPLPTLPRGVRVAALIIAFLASLVWIKSLMDLMPLLFAEAPPALTAPTAAAQRFLDASRVFAEEHDRVVGPMREFRALTLGALWLTCLSIVSAALRLVGPSELPREGVRRFLSRAAIFAALLRAIDGAQVLAITRKLAGPMQSLLSAYLDSSAALHEAQDYTPQLRDQLVAIALPAGTWGAVVLTAVVSGALLALGQYFGSSRVSQAMAPQDRSLQG
jgi:hypothetical protein